MPEDAYLLTKSKADNQLEFELLIESSNSILITYSAEVEGVKSYFVSNCDSISKAMYLRRVLANNL